MPQLKHIAFNSCQDCFAVATDVGIRVFNSRPLVELVNIGADIMGSVKLVALLDRTNFIAIVAGEPRPKFSNKSVMIYDNAKQKFVIELTVSSPIINVLVSSTRIVVVQKCHIHVFSMLTFKLTTHDETGVNANALCALSPNPKNDYIVFPSFKPGSVQVVNLRNTSQFRSTAPATIYAHESEIVKLAIDNQATKIATGSVKGTVIRVFDTHTKAKLFELRRGAHIAQLYCFRFSCDSSYLACCSDQGTIHIFSVTQKPDDRLNNTKKIIDHVRFAREDRSILQYTMPQSDQPAEECAFLSEDVAKSKLDLIAITRDGYIYNFSEWNTKPQGYEILWNLSHDEFWRV